MENRRTEAILTALIFTAFIAIPTASQNINYNSEKTSTPIIDSTSNTEVDIAVSPDIPTTAKIEEHNTLYKVSEIPSQRVETLSTPEASLKIIITNSSRIYKLDTAYGELTKGVKNGRRVSDFRGLNRSRAEDEFTELKSEAGDYRKEVKEEMTPEVDVDITESKAADEDERVVIENHDSREVKLDSWTLQNSDGDTFEFDGLTLEQDQDAYIYTAGEDDLNVTETSDKVYVYGTGTDWDSTSEEASLFNEEGILIEEDSY